MGIVDRFKNGEIYVVCKSKKEAEIFTNIVFSHGLVWRDGGTDGTCWDGSYRYISYVYRYNNAKDAMSYSRSNNLIHFETLCHNYARFMFGEFMDEYVKEFGNKLGGVVCEK